jgi:oxygen-dependent protoporphyrinogen oxidase
MKSCFPVIYNYEQQYGSIIRGALFSKKVKSRHKQSELVKQSKQSWLMWSMKNGLESLPTTLAQSLSSKGVTLLRNSPCTELEITKKGVKVHAKGADNVMEADAVVSAIPAWSLGDLLMSTHPVLASRLKEISAVTVAVVSFEFDGKVLPTEAFGYLVPSHQQSKALGVVFDSCSFPEHDRKGSPSTRMTVMMGGHWFHDLFGDPHSVSEDELIAVARETIIDHLGIKSEPTKVFIRVQKDCIPQYTVGHNKIMNAIDQYIEDQSLPLTLVGSSYRGAAINEITDLSMQAADQLCDTLANK